MFNRPRQVSYFLVDVTDPANTEYAPLSIEKRFPDLTASVSPSLPINTDLACCMSVGVLGKLGC